MAGSKGGRGGQGGGSYTLGTSASDVFGNKIDLTGFPLKYGQDDKSLSGAKRTTITNWEKKRGNQKIEYAYLIDKNGNALCENKGGKGSVNTPTYLFNRAEVFTHIHPRGKGEEGFLGGTFSTDDLRNFGSSANMMTYRAVAQEGVYSISKASGFDAAGLNRYYTAENSRIMSQVRADSRALVNDYKQGKISYDEAVKKNRELYNKGFVEMHDVLLAGQKQYGYTYTLERRK